MTPRQLNYFLVIADLKNFTRASSVLHIAQPALSRQIQQLEEDLGVKLFRRTDAGVSLTDAGELLRERAVGLLDRFEQVRNEVSAQASHPRGTIHVGLPPSMFGMVTVPLAQRYHQLYPDVKARITEGISATLHEAVLAGRMDFAVVSSTVHSRERALSLPGQKFRDLLVEIARAEIALRHWIAFDAMSDWLAQALQACRPLRERSAVGLAA